MVVTVDPGSKPDQKYAWRGDMQDTWERISLVYYTLVHCERVKFKVTGINFMTVFIVQREAACF